MKRLIAVVFACLFVAPAFAETKSAPTNTSLPVPIKQGMKYPKARKALLGAGWQTIPGNVTPNGTPVCYIHATMGMGYKEGKGECDFVEVSDCSGTGMGFCLMSFADGMGRYLYITTALGDPTKTAEVYEWGISDRPSEPNVVELKKLLNIE